MKRNGVLYQDIAKQIKRDIFSRKYPVGTLLPTENEFEEMFGVSKITVRKAIEILAQEELVEKKSGRGTTVLSDRPYNKLSKSTSFTTVLERSEHQIEKRVLSFEIVRNEAATEQYDSFGPYSVRYVRLYLLDGEPYIYFIHYLPSTLADLGTSALANDSLYRMLDQHGFEIARFEDDFAAVRLEGECGDALEAPGELAVRRTRVSRGPEGQVIEYSIAFYLTDRHEYRIEYDA